MARIIWQYWETRGEKPAFIDGLHRLVRQNSGCEVVLVTPDNLPQYLPDLPNEILQIKVLAHKADMIRAMLVARHGGMWLDSDAIVLRDLAWLFDFLDDYNFIGFNNQGLLQEDRPWVRVNCFLSRPGGRVAVEWVRQQHAKFPKVEYYWEEIGTDLLHPICLVNQDLVKILPFEEICPIPWDRVDEFLSSKSGDISAECYVVMLSNAAIEARVPQLRRLSCQDMAEGNFLLSSIMREALHDGSVDSATRITIRKPHLTLARWKSRLSRRIGTLTRQRRAMSESSTSAKNGPEDRS